MAIPCLRKYLKSFVDSGKKDKMKCPEVDFIGDKDALLLQQGKESSKGKVVGCCLAIVDRRCSVFGRCGNEAPYTCTFPATSHTFGQLH